MTWVAPDLHGYELGRKVEEGGGDFRIADFRPAYRLLCSATIAAAPAAKQHTCDAISAGFERALAPVRSEIVDETMIKSSYEVRVNRPNLNQIRI